MSKPLRTAVWSAMVFVALPGAWAAESVQSIEDRLVANWEKLGSLTTTIRKELDVKAGSGRMTQKGAGTYEYQKRGESRFFRQELETENVIDLGGSERLVRQKVLTVCDGAFVYHLTDKDGVRTAVKDRADSRLAAHVGGRAHFDYLRATYILKALPDEELDGRPVCVLEATPKLYRGGEGGKQLLYFDKERGMLVKNVVLSSAGQVMETTVYTDVRVNPNLGPERFRFEPPEGVPIRDLTGGAAVLRPTTQPSTRPSSDD